MKRAIVALAALLVAAAGEQPANRFALDEAALSLADCGLSQDAEQVKLCRHFQDGFRKDYLLGASGDGCAARQIAQTLFFPAAGEVKRNGVLACSWGMLARMMWKAGECFGNIDETVAHYCSDLDPEARASSVALATVTHRLIMIAPSRPPGDIDTRRAPSR